jgi:ATP-binding protein involved in chromosome partitioning
MKSITDSQVREILDRIEVPGQGKSIVAAGMLSGLVIKDGNVGFSLEIRPEDAQAMETLRQKAEQAVLALDGVNSVTAVLTAHRSPHQSQGNGAQQQTAAPQRPQQQQAPNRPEVPGIKAIIAVASGKGGVGKSTTAVNLALAFSQMGLATGILDADVYGPSQPRMLGITGRPVSLDGQKIHPMENFGVKCMSMGFLVDEETPMIWRGPMVTGALQQMLRDVDWGQLDVMVVDMPPGTGDAQLSMSQQVPLAGVVIVSTPQDIALLDARKGLNMFRKVDVPVLGIIENMSLFVCPNCGHEAHIFSHGGARAEAERLGVDFLGEVPLDMEIRETSDGGTPVVVSNPDSPHAKVYQGMAAQVWEKIVGAGQSRTAPNIVMQ